MFILVLRLKVITENYDKPSLPSNKSYDFSNFTSSMSLKSVYCICRDKAKLGIGIALFYTRTAEIYTY